MGFEKHCTAQGCIDYPAFGFKSGPDAHYRWAYLAHRDLLEFGSGQGLSAAEPNVAREGRLDLSVAALPLPNTLATNSKRGRLL